MSSCPAIAPSTTARQLPSTSPSRGCFNHCAAPAPITAPSTPLPSSTHQVLDSPQLQLGKLQLLVHVRHKVEVAGIWRLEGKAQQGWSLDGWWQPPAAANATL